MSCVFPERCGNGIVDAGEQCDDGNTANGDGCSALCTIEIPNPVCGNNIVEPPETCDDGNTINGDGCSSVCRTEGGGPVCGNGILEAGEQCDDGNQVSGDGCNAFCQREPFCGNGIPETGEQCDDGNAINGDGCSTQCQLDGGSTCFRLWTTVFCADGVFACVVCGNNMVEPPEQCDDGNLMSGDGCSATCMLENPGAHS